jgi:ribosomal protein S18 acetylase RimI-like enzyme
MSISSSISRFTAYCKRNGLRATVQRLGLATKRTLFSSRMVLFYCDLSTLSSPATEMPASLKVERHTSQTEISPHELQEITSFWDPELARRRIKERFELGASLWIIKSEDNLAGYGWTLQGRTVEPHYFRLAPDDVHLFDFHVFPQYRGRGLNPLLVRYILRSLAAECQGRAFIEAAEWNQAQLASLRRTPFRHLEAARKFTLFRRTVVFWRGNEIGRQSEDTSSNLPQPVPNRRASEEKA